MKNYINQFQKKIELYDIFIIGAFLIFAIIYFLGVWQGAYPFVFLTSDAANIANFAVGWDHYQDLLSNDPVISNPDNYRFYATIHIPLIRFLSKITGDYGSAFISLLIPHIFLQSLGFYLLGCVIFKSRYWATLLAIINLITIRTQIGADFWGIFIDSIPRFSFQALLPFLLAAILYWGENPKNWWWLMVVNGLLIYFHPVSAPAWGLSIWIGLWGFQKSFKQTKTRLVFLFKSGIVYIATILPWTINYLSNHEHGKTENYEQIYNAASVRLNSDFLDLSGLKDFLSNILSYHSLYLLPLSIISLITIVFIKNKNKKKLTFIWIVMLWLFGLILSSAIIPIIQLYIERNNQLIPVQVDLIRNLRYTIPLMLLIVLWSLSEISISLKNQINRYKFLSVVGLIFTGIWIILNTQIFNISNYIFSIEKPINYTFSCWLSQKYVCLSKEKKYPEVLDGLKQVKELVPAKSRILPLGSQAQRYSLAMRYYAIRPVSYSFKDGNILFYANHTGFLEWYKIHQEYTAIEKQYKQIQNNQSLSYDYKILADRIKNLSKNLDTEYIVQSDWIFNPKIAKYLDAKLLYKNSLFYIWKLEQKI